MHLKKLASSFSLLLCAAAGLAQDYGQIYERLEAAPDEQRQAKLQEVLADPKVKSELKAMIRVSLRRPNDEDAYWAVVDRAEMYALSQSSLVDRQMVKSRIEEIKRSRLYTNMDKGESNWLARAMEKLSEWLSRIRSPRFNAPDINAPTPNLRWITITAWVVLGAIATVLIVLVVRAFRFSRAARRSRSALLDDTEPDRTVDEWLALARQLTAEGRLREAIRCYYVATLLRFDEAGIAAFRREETNWEHLARIVRSGRLPEGMEFRPATERFDRVWYGHQPHGIEDVAMFADLYERAAALREAAA